MRKQLLITIAVLITYISTSFAQNSSLKETVKEYITHLHNFENEKAVEYFNPNYFKVLPKEMLINVINSFTDMEGMELSYNSFQYIGSYGHEMINGNEFALVEYKSNLKVINVSLTKAEFNQIKPIFVPKDGKVLSDNSDALESEITKYMVAEKINDEWTLIEYVRDQPKLLNRIIGAEAAKHIKAVYIDLRNKNAALK